MKNSIKITALIVAITAAAFGAKAQTKPTSVSNSIIYSAGVETGVSLGNFHNAYGWNLGGSIQADIPVASQLYVTANAGYRNYYGKDNIYGTNFTAADLHSIPLKAGIKYFPISHLYVQGEAGAAFALNKSNVGFSNSAAFIYAPSVGFQLPLSGKSYLDAGLRYESSTKFDSNVSYSKTNILGLRVAYAFSSN